MKITIPLAGRGRSTTPTLKSEKIAILPKVLQQSTKPDKGYVKL
jgi:hypothetical protein